MNHTVQQLKSQSKLQGSWELKISGQKEAILQWRKKRKQRVVGWPWTALTCFIFQSTPSSTINSHLPPCYTAVILLSVFSWVYKFIFHSKCGIQANLEKHLSTFVLLKTCLCPQEKSTPHSWKGCYTMAGHASTPSITQHKHQNFIPQQEWTFSCQDFTHLQYGHFLQRMKFCVKPMKNIAWSQPSRSCVTSGYSKDKNKRSCKYLHLFGYRINGASPSHRCHMKQQQLHFQTLAVAKWLCLALKNGLHFIKLFCDVILWRQCDLIPGIEADTFLHDRFHI